MSRCSLFKIGINKAATLHEGDVFTLTNKKNRKYRSRNHDHAKWKVLDSPLICEGGIYLVYAQSQYSLRYKCFHFNSDSIVFIVSRQPNYLNHHLQLLYEESDLAV